MISTGNNTYFTVAKFQRQVFDFVMDITYSPTPTPSLHLFLKTSPQLVLAAYLPFWILWIVNQPPLVTLEPPREPRAHQCQCSAYWEAMWTHHLILTLGLRCLSPRREQSWSRTWSHAMSIFCAHYWVVWFEVSDNREEILTPALTNKTRHKITSISETIFGVEDEPEAAWSVA